MKRIYVQAARRGQPNSVVASVLNELVNKVAWAHDRRRKRRTLFKEMESQPDYVSKLANALSRVSLSARIWCPQQSFSRSRLEFLAKCLMLIEQDLEDEEEET